MDELREKSMSRTDTRVFLKGVENEELRRRIEAFFYSLTSKLDMFGISLAQILQCKLLILKENEGGVLGISGVLKGNYTFVVVEKKYQNRGIGRILFDELVRWAPRASCDFIMGNAVASNVRINRIWREAGGRVLYSTVLGGRKHYLQFISFNWRGVVWGCSLRLLRLIKSPTGLMGLLSKMLKVLRLS